MEPKRVSASIYTKLNRVISSTVKVFTHLGNPDCPQVSVIFKDDYLDHRLRSFVEVWASCPKVAGSS